MDLMKFSDKRNSFVFFMNSILRTVKKVHAPLLNISNIKKKADDMTVAQPVFILTLLDDNNHFHIYWKS